MAEVPEAFEREQGCTQVEWLRWLPGAVRDCPLALADHAAMVEVGAGRLQLRWTELPPRRIALITMPRMQVHYRFEGVAAAERAAFMRYFDLYLQRGGG